MARKNKSKDDEQNANEWLATYADTITLLMTFFVLLYSMSSVDSSKSKAVSQAFDVIMKGESGNTIYEYQMYNGNVPLVGGSTPIESNNLNEDTESKIDMYEEAKKSGDLYEEAKKNGDLEYVTNINDNLYDVIEQFVNNSNLKNEIEIIKDEQGVVMRLKDNILFDTASAKLNSSSYIILDKVSELLRELNKKILVEGHTDNRPINTYEYPSNWELSTDRAVNVVKYFITVGNVNPEKLSAAGYAEYKPLVENNSEKNMAINRRVSILILYNNNEIKGE